MKKLNKFFAVLVALAMMATLCVSMAFAADPVTQSTAPGKAVLTKVFDVPEGVAVPEATFKFDFTNKAKPGSATGTVAQQEIKWTATDVANLKGEQLKNLYLKDVFKYDAETLIIDTANSALTQPGEYVYLVEENEAASTYTKVAAPSTDNIKYDGTKYTLRVYVIRETVGEGDEAHEVLKIKTITVETGDTTSAETPSDPAKKVNPDEVIDEGEDPGTSDDVSKGSAFKYTNVYTKTVKTDPNDPNGAFNIEKDVTGSGDTAAQFPFTVTIKLDENTALTDNKLTGYVGTTAYEFNFYDEENEKVVDTATLTTVKLADGEKLKFTEFPAGATVTFTETLNASDIQNKALYTKKTSGTALQAAEEFAKGTDAAGTTIAINDVAAVKVENNLKNDDIQPEGILISNLPYIALALVAIGGLVAYIVVRRRNADEA